MKSKSMYYVHTTEGWKICVLICVPSHVIMM